MRSPVAKTWLNKLLLQPTENRQIQTKDNSSNQYSVHMMRIDRNRCFQMRADTFA